MNLGLKTTIWLVDVMECRPQLYRYLDLPSPLCLWRDSLRVRKASRVYHPSTFYEKGSEWFWSPLSRFQAPLCFAPPPESESPFQEGGYQTKMASFPLFCWRVLLDTTEIRASGFDEARTLKDPLTKTLHSRYLYDAHNYAPLGKRIADHNVAEEPRYLLLPAFVNNLDSGYAT